MRQSACTAERFTFPYTKHEEESSRTGTQTGAGQVFIQIAIGVGIAIGIDCRAHEAARNDECKGGGGPEPDSDGTVMEPRNV